jgi:uncharacterized protein DUF4375
MTRQIEPYWEILEPFFAGIDTGGSPETYGEAIRQVPRPVVLMYATHMCLAEVHNGGLLQFFWKSTGIVAPETIQGFVAMGMPKLASLVKTGRFPSWTSLSTRPG